MINQGLSIRFSSAALVSNAFNDVMPHTDVYLTNGGYGPGGCQGIEHKADGAAGVHEGKNEINARGAYFKLGINLGTESPKPRQLLVAVTGY